MNWMEWCDNYGPTDRDRRLDRTQYKEITSRKYESLAEVTLSAFTEIGQPELSIPVPKQKSYTGRKPVIPSSVADTLCAKLGVAGILEKLNIILGTSYTLEMRSLCSVLESYIIKDYDFGTAFSYLRPFWYNDLTDVKDTPHTREAWDQQMRRDALVNNKIISRLLPPRRVWDLFSNRVVPWWVSREYPMPMSHAWMKEEDRMDMHTPVNGHEWPVPMPRDANLNLIRIEMLNHGAEYAWLDVLCLRQVGGRGEDLRAEEWKVDVPTIGRVYTSCMSVVCYLSGLGRPFSLRENHLESDTCWFRRAWTLQEIQGRTTIAGDTGDDRFIEKEMRTTVENRLSLLKQGVGALATPVFIALSEMQKRVSTNPLDRVAGLSYLLLTEEIPAYHPTQPEEDAWNALVNEMDMTHRGQMFFLYPQPGNGNMFWRPSWRQAMTEVLPPPHLSDLHRGWNTFIMRTKEKGYVQGLAEESLAGSYRQGELIVEDITGTKHTFKIVAYHQCPIPEDSYALVGSKPLDHSYQVSQKQCWVIGKRLTEQLFEKFSVFQIPDKDEVKRLHDLGIATNAETDLA